MAMFLELYNLTAAECPASGMQIMVILTRRRVPAPGLPGGVRRLAPGRNPVPARMA